MRKFLILAVCAIWLSPAFAQKKTHWLTGMYLQWGYNTEWYTKSNIHFNSTVNGVPHNFTMRGVKAHDRNDLDGIVKKPLAVTVPQYNYRIGFYLNTRHTRAIEFNFDHTKYIIYNNQEVRAKGYIGNDHFDKDTSFTHDQVAFEHTNGANFYHINYVQQHTLLSNRLRPVITAVWKAGAGFLIPKTDVTLSGKRLDNKFHLAGYCFGAEGGSRWYFAKRIFLEGTAKAGFANYTNSLALDNNGRINHSFGYFELIGTLGYDIRF
jgi:hypothetical protein